MPKPVSLLTVQEAHKEYSSLTDQIRAKYEQLDSGEFGSPGTPAFDAEACELANLLAHVSQLCQRLNLPMPKPVSLLTVQEAHKEYSSLTDQIRAKYEQLDSGEFGSPGTPAFDAEACELANLLARVSQLCQRLNLPMPKELYIKPDTPINVYTRFCLNTAKSKFSLVSPVADW